MVPAVPFAGVLGDDDAKICRTVMDYLQVAEILLARHSPLPLLRAAVQYGSIGLRAECIAKLKVRANF